MTMVAGLLVAAGAGLCVAGAAAGGAVAAPSRLASGWSDPEGPAQHVVARLEAEGVHDAFGTYWTAYVLQYLAGRRIRVTASPDDYVRNTSLLATVAGSPHPAWLFAAPGHRGAAARAFDNSEPGPGGWTEGAFERLLVRQHVHFRVLHVGVLDAVWPDRKVALPRGSPGRRGKVG